MDDRSLGRTLGGAPPPVEPCDLTSRASRRRSEVVADRPGHGEQHDLRDTLGQVQQVGDAIGGTQVQGRPGAAQAARPQRQAERPRRLDDRVEQAGSSAAVVLAVDAHQDDRRHVLEVAGQVCTGVQGAFVAVAGARNPFGVLDYPVAAGLAVEVGQGSLGVGVADDQPATAGLVPSGRSLLGEVDAVQEQLLGDLPLEVQATADGPGGGQQAVGLADGEGHVAESTTASPTRRCRPPVGVRVRPLRPAKPGPGQAGTR